MQQQNSGGGKLLRNRSGAKRRSVGLLDFPFCVRPAAGFLESGLAVHCDGSRSHESLVLACLLEIVMEFGLEIGGSKKPSGCKRADKDPAHHFLHGCNHKAAKKFWTA